MYGATKGTRPDRIRTLLVRGAEASGDRARFGSARQHHPAAESVSYSPDACPLLRSDGLGIGRDRSGLLGPFLTDSRTSPKMGPRRRPGEGPTIARRPGRTGTHRALARPASPKRERPDRSGSDRADLGSSRGQGFNDRVARGYRWLVRRVRASGRTRRRDRSGRERIRPSRSHVRTTEARTGHPRSIRVARARVSRPGS